MPGRKKTRIRKIEQKILTIRAALSAQAARELLAPNQNGEQSPRIWSRLMTPIPHNWMVAFGLALVAADFVLPHPRQEASNEYPLKALIPQHALQGFRSEQQWLFAHRKFRNKCVLEALAEDERREGAPRTASHTVNRGFDVTDIQLSIGYY